MGGREGGREATQEQTQEPCPRVCTGSGTRAGRLYLVVTGAWGASPGQLLTFFMLPRVTVDKALDIRRGLRPRKSPIFPSTCTMYLAIRRQRGEGRASHPARDTHCQTTHPDQWFPKLGWMQPEGVCVQGPTQANSEPQVSSDLSLLVKRSSILLTNKPTGLLACLLFLSFENYLANSTVVSQLSSWNAVIQNQFQLLIKVVCLGWGWGAHRQG